MRPGLAPIAEDGKGVAGRNGGGGSGDGGDGKMPPLHPLIKGLIEVLPPNGKTWTDQDALEWLQTAAGNLRYAYKFPGRIKPLEPQDSIPIRNGGDAA